MHQWLKFSMADILASRDQKANQKWIQKEDITTKSMFQIKKLVMSLIFLSNSFKSAIKLRMKRKKNSLKIGKKTNSLFLVINSI